MSIKYLSFFIFVFMTIRAAGNDIIETDCGEGQLKTSKKIVKEQIVYHHLDEDSTDYKILTCHYTHIGGTKYHYALDVQLGNKYCSFSVDVAQIGGTVMVKNEVELREQNKQCEEGSTTAEYKRLASEGVELTLNHGMPILKNTDIDMQAALDQVFHTEELKNQKHETIQHLEQIINQKEEETSKQFEALVQDTGSKGTIEEIKKNPSLLGGFHDCNDEQKSLFLSDTLAHMDHSGLFVTKDVLKCSVQIVAGLNVKITFGSEQEKSCHAHIFYPLGDAEPQIELKRVGCIPGKKQSLLGAPSEEEKCDDFIRNRALKSFKKNINDPVLIRAYKENVVSCLSQFADGTKVHLTLSFNGFTCDYFVFFAPTMDEFTSGKANCRYN